MKSSEVCAMISYPSSRTNVVEKTMQEEEKCKIQMPLTVSVVIEAIEGKDKYKDSSRVFLISNVISNVLFCT